MILTVHPDRAALGRAAAADGAELIRDAIRQRGSANIVVATGMSQLEVLRSLAATPDLEWHKITAFHLDEYVGLPITHPASFRRYLWERFVRVLPLPLAAFNYVDGETDPQSECRRLGAILESHVIDVAFIGIGENGHLAFNDPPADFRTADPFTVVTLDDACRRQQVGEGWFPSIDDVPRQAISMSCRQIMKATALIVSVPDERKAEAVRATLEGPVTNHVPASLLQRHRRAMLHLDESSATLLGATTRAKAVVSQSADPRRPVSPSGR